MRLAVFTNQFPSRVSTFFARDLRALLQHGIEVEVFTLHPYVPALWDFVPERQRALLRDRIPIHGANPRAILPALRSGVWPRPEGWRLTRPILRSAASFGPRATIYTSYAALQAVRWATLHRSRFDHILAYWGNYSATSAYLFQRLTEPATPLSMILHAGTDLYRDQVFLAEKMLHADNIFVVCEFNRDYIRRLVPSHYAALAPKIRLHHLGLDLSEFPFSPTGRSPNNIVGVGRFDPVKGFEDLIRATAVLVAQGVPVTLELVGDGPERYRLQRLSRELGLASVLRFPGWLSADATRQVVQRASLLVHPSRALGDAVPTVIKEAMALGTPVVGTRVAGIPELLDEGRCGVLVSPGRPTELAEGVRALLASAALRESYAARGRERAEALFDLARTGERLARRLRGTSGAGSLQPDPGPSASPLGVATE